jgi:elongation factor P--beta-lysine ligase
LSSCKISQINCYAHADEQAHHYKTKQNQNQNAMQQQIECKTTTTAPQDVKDCTGVALKFPKLTKKKKKKKKIPLLCHHTLQKLKGTL